MARAIRAEEIFNAGYAVPMYDIKHGVRHWRFRGEEFTLPARAVPLVEPIGIGFYVARIENVRKAANG